jgi:PIN domain nuclease of toxin-antitoxin system
MKYLIDTEVFLRMQAQPATLGPKTTRILMDARSEMYLSAASAWEIAIKFRLGRVVLPRPPAVYVPERMAASRMLYLSLDANHALGVSTLDDHHTDPVDRLLVSQARAEEMTIITTDPTLADYGGVVLDARA